MEVLRNGKFSLPILSSNLSKGLRKESSNTVNEHALISCSGMVGKNGVLQRLVSLVRSFDIDYTFPYPQIFVETNITILCTQTEIYEIIDNNPELKLTVSGGSTWTLVSSHDFVYLSNGVVSVVRNPESKVFSITTDVPTSMAVCNYNGQIIIGAPDAGYEI